MKEKDGIKCSAWARPISKAAGDIKLMKAQYSITGTTTQ